MTTERLLAAYHGLKAKEVELAAFYAEANPQRGGPRRHPTSSSADITIVASRRVPRRKRNA